MADTESKLTALSEDRKSLCIEAAWEIDALARILPDHVPNDENGTHFIVRGISGRLLRLTSALMSALDDDAVSTEQISKMVLLTGSGQG